MKLVWTYYNNLDSSSTSKNNLKNYYKRSIWDAKHFGLSTEMYSNDLEFKDHVDVFHYISKEVMFWDEYKMEPLNKEDEEVVLVDGDIVWHQKFKLNRNVDVVFDCYEIDNWNLIYKEDVDRLTQLGIRDSIPEWDGKRRAVMNTGILGFNNNELRKLYIDRYSKFKEIVSNHRDKVNVNKCTWIGAQYLLTSIVDNKGFSSYSYSTRLGESNGLYTHHAGAIKNTGAYNPLKY